MKGEIKVPEGWPQGWAAEYAEVVKKRVAKEGKRRLFNAAARHLAYCSKTGKILLSCDAIISHRSSLRLELNPSLANAYARDLADVAWRRKDKVLRDDLFDCFPDTRSATVIIAAPYAPPSVRQLGMRALQNGEITIKDIKALDRYLRVVDRLGALPVTAGKILAAFWRHPVSEKYSCEVLGQVASMIDMFLPGSPDANTLREVARSLRPITPLVCRSRQPVDPRIVSLVDTARQRKRGQRGRRYSKSKRAEQQGVLRRLEKVLQAAGHSFSLDRNGINIFAQHAYDQFRARQLSGSLQPPHSNGADGASRQGWSAIYIARTLETIADFVEEKGLRDDLLLDAREYHLEAKKQIKIKELHLAKNPTSLPQLFSISSRLVEDATYVPIKSRARLLNTAGVIALLCSYPLRRANVAMLRFGHELVRVLGGWALTYLYTQKTGDKIEPLYLPKEVTPILDAALLQGAGSESLWKVYSQRTGQALWSDWRTGRSLSAELMTFNLKALAGCSPHMFRTIWADHLVESGADRAKISIVLQHRSLISQKEYEVLASKLRLSQGVSALAEVIRDAERGGRLSRRP